MAAVPPVLLALDLAGTFAFALNGALTTLRVADVDIVGVVTLAMITAVGGGTVRDVLVRQVPSVLTSGLYAIPALIGAALAVLATRGVVHEVLGAPAALGAAGVCS